MLLSKVIGNKNWALRKIEVVQFFPNYAFKPSTNFLSSTELQPKVIVRRVLLFFFWTENLLGPSEIRQVCYRRLISIWATEIFLESFIILLDDLSLIIVFLRNTANF